MVTSAFQEHLNEGASSERAPSFPDLSKMGTLALTLEPTSTEDLWARLPQVRPNPLSFHLLQLHADILFYRTMTC